MIVNLHSNQTLQIFDFIGIHLRPVGVTIQGHIPMLSKVLNDPFCSAEGDILAFFFKSIVIRDCIRFRESKSHQMMVFSSRQFNVQFCSWEHQKIISVQFLMGSIYPVIRNCQKIIPFAPVMFCNLCRRVFSVRSSGMGMKVSLFKTSFCIQCSFFHVPCPPWLESVAGFSIAKSSHWKNVISFQNHWKFLRFLFPYWHEYFICSIIRIDRKISSFTLLSREVLSWPIWKRSIMQKVNSAKIL